MLQMNACFEQVIGWSGRYLAPNGMLIEVTRHFSDTAPHGDAWRMEDKVRNS